MTKEFKTFLTELADLLEKHDVEIEGSEDTWCHSAYCDGIDLNQNSKYDDDGEMIQTYHFEKFPKIIDAQSIREFLEKH